MPFGLQPIHLVMIAIVALLIFGPARLPEIGRGIGKAITEFRRGAKEMGGSFMEEVNQPVDLPGQSVASQANVAAAPASTSSVEQGHFCIHCGKSNSAEAVFCNQCGLKVAE
jgi:sec-independent protein translocase protein TatA